jgi:hypothetical protein
MAKQILTILLVVLAACLLLLPAALNGFPFLFFDTRGYYNMGEGIFRLLAEIPFFHGSAAPPGALDPAAPAGAVDRLTTDEISLARSPFYGMFFYVMDLVSPWLFAVLQAGVVAWLLWLVATRTGIGGHLTYLSLMLVAACTALPIFAAYAMPDIWASIAVIIVFLMTSCLSDLRPIERIALTSLLAFALLVHVSHILLVGALLAAIVLWGLMRPARRMSRAGPALVAAALAVAVAGDAATAVAAKLRFGVWPAQPPLLMARVIEDGPGQRLIAAECGEDAWLVCRFEDRIDGDSQAFLWSTDSQDGVYALLSPDEKRRLGREELPFVLRAVASAPVAQVRASAVNWLEQLLMFGRYEFATATEFTELVPLYMPHRAAGFAASGAARDAWPWGALSILDYGMVALSIGALIWSAGRWRLAAEPAACRVRRFLGVVFAALVINAFVCGVLSDPHHRYQARLIWLLPAAAVLNVAAVRRTASPMQRLSAATMPSTR